jgi:hypothetical protein
MSGYVPILPFTDEQVLATMRAELDESEWSGPRRPVEKLILAALSSIPWVGTLVSAVTSTKTEEEGKFQNYLLRLWVEEHRRRLIMLGRTFQEVQSRFENFGDEINERIESEAYLALVRKAFREWDQ